MPAFLHAVFLFSIVFFFFLFPFSLVYSSFLPVTLNLERSFPENHKTELNEIKRRDEARHGRMLLSYGGVVDFPVDGSSDPFTVGLYFTRVKIGSPPKEFYVQIDTGSDILWVSCDSCQGCPKSSGLGIQLQFYNPQSSASTQPVSCSDNICNAVAQTTDTECSSQNSQCTYSFTYGDGSGTSGYFVSDVLNFDAVVSDSSTANASAPIVFGCSTYQTGDLIKTDRAVNGILGLGQNELSVISQLASRGISPRVFSHCLKGRENGGGILVLGEIVEPSIVFSPLVQSQPHYNLNLLSIAINGRVVPLPSSTFETTSSRGTIIDSGTTLTYIAEEAYGTFLNALTSAVTQPIQSIQSKGNMCFLSPVDVNEIFPSVSFNFAGAASIGVQPDEYLIHQGYVDGAALWCLGFQTLSGGVVNILGDLVLKDKIVVYDLARQRIGWADYDCSKSVNVSVASPTGGRGEYFYAGQVSGSSCMQAQLNKLIHIIFLVYIVMLSGFQIL